MINQEQNSSIKEVLKNNIIENNINYVEQTNLLMNIIHTEQSEKKYSHSVIDYLNKYIYILKLKITTQQKYNIYNTSISIFIIGLLILFYIYEKQRYKFK